ncbi:unnamed protein product, partial [Pylaiella littoralis]
VGVVVSVGVGCTGHIKRAEGCHFRSPASSLFVWRPVCCVCVRVHSLSLCALPVSSPFLFSCLSSIDHIVTGPCALVCLCLGLSWPWALVRCTKYFEVYGYG